MEVRESRRNTEQCQIPIRVFQDRPGYIFNYPLVMYYGNMYMRAIDTQSKIYSGGFGQWVHLRISSPKDTGLSSSGNPGKRRFYAPTQAYFDKSWRIGDFEKAV